MKKIGNILGILFLVAGLGVFKASAQNTVSVEATVSKTTILTGERLQLSITIGGEFTDVQRPTLPQFSGLRLLSQVPSTSRRMSYVNGVSSSSYTYSYFLIATDVGQYTIPPITVEVNGESYTTDAITIEVVKNNSAAQNDSPDEQNTIFLKLEVSDDRVVTGEQVVADVMLYFKEGMQVNSYQPVPGWKAQGFWKEQLNNNRRPQVKPVIINGVRYRKARLLQFALFPTKAGTLTISPYSVKLSVRTATSRNDPFSSFFGGFGRNRQQLELKTDPVPITVEALPSSSKGEYIGAVGSFDIERTVNASEPRVGESIEIVTTIKGIGNIPLIDEPGYKLPNKLEEYQPEEETTINRSNNQISGTSKFSRVVVARVPGKVTIPEATLSFYDPAEGKYITKILPAKTINVSPNPNSLAQADGQQMLSIQAVTGLANWQTVADNPQALSRYWWFWVGILLPLFGLGIGYWQRNYWTKMGSDRLFARSQKATQVAKQRLQQALQYAEQKKIADAYNILQRALTGFMGDRLGLPEAGLSIEQYITALEENKVNKELIQNVRMLLNKCETINYAPNASYDYLKSHVALAESIIAKLKKEL